MNQEKGWKRSGEVTNFIKKMEFLCKINVRLPYFEQS